MNEILPLGTIIKIFDKEEKYIIIGKFIKKDDKIYDYKCAVYPQGISFEAEIIDINNKDIEEIFFLGNVNY
jgi:hypothetical protein